MEMAWRGAAPGAAALAGHSVEVHVVGKGIAYQVLQGNFHPIAEADNDGRRRDRAVESEELKTHPRCDLSHNFDCLQGETDVSRLAVAVRNLRKRRSRDQLQVHIPGIHLIEGAGLISRRDTFIILC